MSPEYLKMKMQSLHSCVYVAIKELAAAIEKDHPDLSWVDTLRVSQEVVDTMVEIAGYAKYKLDQIKKENRNERY